MSCTIFYHGKLKRKHSVQELFQVLIEKIKTYNWKFSIFENCFSIDLNDGKSENLIFDFEDHKMDGFCKIYSEDDEVFKKIFDLFLDIKNMFYPLEVSDDLGMWADYLASKNPCKIKLRELTDEELEFINRFNKNELSSNILYGIIVSDMKKIKGDAISYEYIENYINPNIITYLTDTYEHDFAILEAWIYDTMEYKNQGRVCDILEKNPKLNNNIQAFSFGIAETVLGTWGGSTGNKQAQIRKLFALEIYYRNIDLEKDHILMYRFVLSVLDYLGFKRVK